MFLLVTVMTLKPTTILTLEESCFASPQQSITGALASESNSACFLQSSRNYYEFAREGQTLKIFIWRL
jgi:hypothetical protein